MIITGLSTKAECATIYVLLTIIFAGWRLPVTFEPVAGVTKCNKHTLYPRCVCVCVISSHVCLQGSVNVQTGFMCLYFAVVVVLLETLFLLLMICWFLLLFLNVIMCLNCYQRSHFSGRLFYLMRVEFDGAFRILLNIGRISCGFNLPFLLWKFTYLFLPQRRQWEGRI